MPSLQNATDIIAYDQAGRVVLLAETRTKFGASAQWAAQFRRNMLSHGTLPDAQFFLIATPEHLFFWKQDHSTAADQLPQVTLDATRELKPYLEGVKRTADAVSERALEVLVFMWIADIGRDGESRRQDDTSARWLSESGLAASLRKARIEFNPV